MKHLQLTSEELGTICRSLAYLLHAGSSSGDALALLAEDAQDAALEGKFRQMAQQTDAGESLSAAFRQAGCFPQYIPALLEVGERSGRTEEALNALCRFYEGRARMEKRLRAALLYPAVLLVVMLAVIVMLLAWVLPVFNEVYMQLGSGLTCPETQTAYDVDDGHRRSAKSRAEGISPAACRRWVKISGKRTVT